MENTLSKNWKNSAFEEGEGSANCSKQREGQRDNNILLNNLWVFNIYVASCSDDAIFIWFSLICLESLGFH